MHGRYPKFTLDDSGEKLLDVRSGDMEMIKAPLDFIGLNYYVRTIVEDGEGGGPSMRRPAGASRVPSPTSPGRSGPTASTP